MSWSLLGLMLAVNASWTCSNEAWVSPPVVHKGVLTGSMESTCILKDAPGGGLSALFKHLTQLIERGQVHDGPIAETFYGLPGVRYDVTEKMGKKTIIHVHEIAHLATDGSVRLVYTTASLGVEASGMAGYIKKMNKTLEVELQDDGTYRVHIMSEMAVDKPWYAPEGLFVDKATSLAHQKFREVRGLVIPDVAAHL
jgi:hypothetical protein